MPPASSTPRSSGVLSHPHLNNYTTPGCRPPHIVKLWLIAESGSQRFAIESSLVSDVLPATENTSRGQITYQEQLIEVIDLETILHGRQTAGLLGNRIVVIDGLSRDKGSHVGLLAERVLDTLEAAPLPPTTDSGIPAELVNGTVPDGDELLPCLNLVQLVNQAEKAAPVATGQAPQAENQTAESCWSSIGVFGDGECPELAAHLHCRNCPTMINAGRSVFHQPTPSGYLAELSERHMQEKHDSVQKVIQTFVFCSGDRWFGIDSAFVERVISPQSIHRLPFRSNDILLGTANVSGELLLAFAINPIFGQAKTSDLSHTERLPVARMVVVRSQSSEFILLVDDVLGIEDFPESHLENEIPVDLPPTANPFVIGMVRVGQIRPMILNVELLLKQLAKEMLGTGPQPMKSTTADSITWTFENRLPELQRLSEVLEKFGEARGVAPGLISQLNVCLDELFTNAVNYGYEPGTADEIQITASVAEGQLQFVISAGGRKFDPFTQAPPPDIESDLEDRKVGGLGVHLAREMVDEYSYDWRADRNIITLRKRLTP